MDIASKAAQLEASGERCIRVRVRCSLLAAPKNMTLPIMEESYSFAAQRNMQGVAKMLGSPPRYMDCAAPFTNVLRAEHELVAVWACGHVASTLLGARCAKSESRRQEKSCARCQQHTVRAVAEKRRCYYCNKPRREQVNLGCCSSARNDKIKNSLVVAVESPTTQGKAEGRRGRRKESGGSSTAREGSGEQDAARCNRRGAQQQQPRRCVHHWRLLARRRDAQRIAAGRGGVSV